MSIVSFWKRARARIKRPNSPEREARLRAAEENYLTRTENLFLMMYDGETIGTDEDFRKFLTKKHLKARIKEV